MSFSAKYGRLFAAKNYHAGSAITILEWRHCCLHLTTHSRFKKRTTVMLRYHMIGYYGLFHGNYLNKCPISSYFIREKNEKLISHFLQLYHNNLICNKHPWIKYLGMYFALITLRNVRCTPSLCFGLGV